MSLLGRGSLTIDWCQTRVGPRMEQADGQQGRRCSQLLRSVHTPETSRVLPVSGIELVPLTVTLGSLPLSLVALSAWQIPIALTWLLRVAEMPAPFLYDGVQDVHPGFLGQGVP